MFGGIFAAGKEADDMVYVMLADGLEEIETVTPMDILRRGGVDVIGVSLKEDKRVTGAHGIPIIADTSVYELTNADDMEVLILPGGSGHELLDASNEVHGLINHALANGLYIAAICAAPSIIGKKMILSGKKATCFPGYEKYLYGADVVREKVVRDGKIITASGAGAAAEFGFEILSALKGAEVAQNLKGTMQYK